MAERYRLFESGFLFSGNEYCYTLKSPAVASKAQVDYISALFAEIESTLAAGKLPEQIDLESWVDYYLVQEVFANFDPCSVYFYKDSDTVDGKIYAGPIWDFDKSLGSPVYEGVGSPDQLCAGAHTIFERLYNCAPFRQLAAEAYREKLLPLLEDLLNGTLDAYAAEIAVSAHMNELRWKNEDLHSWELQLDGVDAQVAYLNDFLRQRREFLNITFCGADRVTVDYVSYAPLQKLGAFTVDRGDAAGELPALNFEGYTFLGWFDAETDAPYDPNAPLTESRRFVAKWKRSSGVTTYDSPLTPRKMSGLKTYLKIAELAHDVHPKIEAMSLSILADTSLQYMYFYYHSHMHEPETLALLRETFATYFPYFIADDVYSGQRKLLGRIARVSPRLYYILFQSKRSLYDFFRKLAGKI